MQKTRKSMVYTGLTILACIAMLVAATFAWFTDSVTNRGNKIQAGSLNVTFEEFKNDAYTPVGEEPIFNYSNWEPGYTDVHSFKIGNDGSLALKYQLDMTGTPSELTDNLVVYYRKETGPITEMPNDLTDFTPVGTLTDVLNSQKDGGIANGHLLAGEGSADYATIAIQMPTSVGNTLNGLEGTFDFDIILKATQYTAEEDGFGNPNYDAEAGYTTTVDSDAIEDVQNAVNALKNGDTVKLMKSFTVPTTPPEGPRTDFDFTNPVTATLDLNGQTITGYNGNITTRVTKGGADITIANGKITAENGTFCTVSAKGEDEVATLRLNNMQLYNTTQNGNSVKAFVNGHIILNNVNSESVKGGGIEAAGGTVDVYNSTFTQKTDGRPIWNSVNIAASGGTGTVNVYSGSFTSENYGAYIFNSGGTINIYDGTFTADRAVLRADNSVTQHPSVINISGGSFDGKIEIGNASTLKISGGTFSNTGLTLEQFKAYVTEGHTVTESNGVFTVA